MKASKGTLIYIMGAGRSGTTALATFLGNSENTLNIGEMHQFFEHLEERKECSCGDQLQKCRNALSVIDAQNCGDVGW